VRKKENSRKGLPPNPKTAKIWDAEWEVVWAIFKENRDKINVMKENWMKDETDTWEEQGIRANLRIDLALQDNPPNVDRYKKELEKLDENKINRLDEEKKITIGKSKVLVSRNNQNAKMDESLTTLIDIPSNDPVTRKEAINKEIDFIRKKWSEMNQKQLEKKLLIEKEVYENDKRFDLLKEEEKDLILTIALGDFKLKLRKND
jgi:hypothetical protein